MIPVALQLWSVKQIAAEDLAGTLKKIADLGYDGVEFAGFYDQKAADVKKMLDDNGLRCAGSHAKWYDLMEPDALPASIEYHQAIGCTDLIIPFMEKKFRDTPDKCRETGERLTELVNKLGEQGLRTGYHNHHDDMTPLEGGKSAWDLLAEHTPASFILQYDTANGMTGGADPVQPLLDHPGRGESTHLKEFTQGDEAVGRAAIGEGVVPWAKVFDACRNTAGTKWYVVELEGAHADPFSTAGRSLDFIRANAGA